MPLSRNWSSRHRRLALLTGVFIVATCGLVYELICGAVASYLLGDSVTQYSLVIGLFLASMGIGSYATRFLHRALLDSFIAVQIGVGLIGGLSAAILYGCFALDLDVQVAVVAVTIAVGSLVGMEIPLLVRILRRDLNLRDTVAQVFSVDYLGALGASVLFPFFLLPFLGLIRAAAVFGLINVLVAGTGIAIFSRELKHRRRLSSCTFAAAVVLLSLVVVGDPMTQAFEDHLYQDEIILKKQSKYQRIVITRWEKDIRLFLNGHLQFSSADEHRYHEPLVFPAMSLAQKHNDRLRVLVLGGGDGIAAKKILKFKEVQSVDLVDLDPAVTKLFQTRPLLTALNDNSLNSEKVRIHHEDAFVFLRKPTERPYHAIIMDLPDPSSPATAKLYSGTMFKMAMAKLAPDGVLVTQATSPFYARKAFWSIHETVRRATTNLGPHTMLPYHVYVPSFGDWGFVMVARQPDLQPNDLPLAYTGDYLTEQTFPAMFAFAPDSGPIDVQTNELDRPILVHYHESGWKNWNN